MNRNLFFAILFLSNVIHATAQPEKENGALTHKNVPHWKLGLSILHAYVPAGSQGAYNEALLLVPAVGIELLYNVNARWGIIWTNEVTMQSYVVNNEKEDNLLREFPYVSALVVNYHLWNRFYINAGPGIEIEKHQNFVIFRFGLEYELLVADGWDVAPAIHYETKQGKFGTVYVGITLARRYGK